MYIFDLLNDYGLLIGVEHVSALHSVPYGPFQRRSLVMFLVCLFSSGLIWLFVAQSPCVYLLVVEAAAEVQWNMDLYQ